MGTEELDQCQNKIMPAPHMNHRLVIHSNSNHDNNSGKEPKSLSGAEYFSVLRFGLGGKFTWQM